jgi:serine/threonine-protein kinase
VAPLGAGGMGEVYRATDTNLKRQVAVKILPAALAADPDRLARFQREAEALASVNHPHIAAVYGLEDADGVKALVMELVEGPTLADRIAQGRLPLDEAVPIARQIAEALEAAHGQGIVHRDLKPANIKVRDDGTVKVLDFGLAKLAEQRLAGRGGRDDPSESPTLTSPAVTGMGVILGTATYMSPEQARGRAVDKRTDIWAFGAVLYEMLTGARAFDGEDITEVMAAVVKTTPNWKALPADVPHHIVTLIQQCLEKDRNARIGDIAVARFLLSEHATPGPPPIASPHPAGVSARWRQAAPVALAAVFVVTAIGWLLPRRQAGMPPATHLQMSVLPAESLTPNVNTGVRPSRIAIALSPDGRLAVFAGARNGAAQLYARPLDRADASPIPGTEGAVAPFFSPDGAWVGFIADNKIRKVPAAGGTAATICDMPAAGPSWGASWGEDGTVFFAARPGIFRVSSAGGTPAAVTTVDAAKGERHLLPQLLPGGKALVFTAPPNVVLRSLDDGRQRILIEGAADARYVEPGYLVYMKTGTLMGVPFDARSRQVTGSPAALVDGVMQGLYAPNGNDETLTGQFAISKSGTLVYALGGGFPMRQNTLMWVDRNGAEQPVAGAAIQMYLNPRLSRDGQKIAVETKREQQGSTDVWVYDLSRGSPTRLTFDGGGRPVWSPDSTRLVYTHSIDGINNLYLINADGSGKPERLTTSDVSQTAASWAAGSNTIAFLQRPTPDTFGIWVLPMEGPAARKPVLFLESRFNLTYPELSPDGRHMAYVSVESGAQELYVQAYPGGGEKTRISTAGAYEPIWTANGRELLYRSYSPGRGQLLLAAAIQSLSPFRADAPRVLFEKKPAPYDATVPLRAWDASADGRRFLFMRFSESTEKPVSTLQVVLNWSEELKQRVPTR